MDKKKAKKVVVIISHPDDEVLWTGATLLDHPEWQCDIICLCRKYDSDRAPRFYKALNAFHSEGAMGDLDDGPAQLPQDKKEIERLILELLPDIEYDLVITHNPSGEYTRHLRHEETGAAVMSLWSQGNLPGKELWIFAYEDGNRKYFPQAQKTADLYFELSAGLWKQKYELITDIYGFGIDSWEAQATPKAEAFWRFTKKEEASKSLQEKQTV